MTDIEDNVTLRTNWRKVLKTASLGNNLYSSAAKLCMQIGEDGPAKSRQRVVEWVRLLKVTKDEAMTYLDAVTDMEDMMRRGIQTHAIPTPTNDWYEVGGGHMRKNHLSSEHFNGVGA